MYKKGLALAIIVLFIGVSYQPVFAINPKSKDETIDNNYNNENEYEYIIEITKENKVITYSVFLTEEQANDLDILIDSMHSKLNNSKSNDNTINIFYDAVDSFNNLGIFPDNISINEIKQLVTGENRDLDKIRFKEEMGNGFENRLCFVSSYTTNGYFLDSLNLGPIILVALLAFIPLAAYASFMDFLELTFNLSKFKLLTMLFMIPWCILITPLILSVLSIFSFEPVSIGSLITYGRYVPQILEPQYQEYFPSYGWIYTCGLNGMKSYSGYFYGMLIKIPAIFMLFYSGIVGFTGISIRKPDKSVFRLGFGLHVKIDVNHPGV